MFGQTAAAQALRASRLTTLIYVSPRKNRRPPEGTAEVGPGAFGGPQRAEEAPDGDWIVRPVSGAAATKTYRCPGCDQEIPPGVGHLVTWPSDSGGVWHAAGADDRRHWHRPCWNNRLNRRRR